MIRIWKFLKNHPLSRSNHSNSILRFLKWQFASRTLNLPVIFPFVNNTRLIAQRGFSSGSGNYYVGLLEFEEMSFLLHYLRKEDCFVDVGANIGAYTVLASGAIGAECISIEPIPITFQVLIDNININSLNLKVHALNVGLSNEPGYLQFSSGAGSMNHVINASENIQNNVKVKVTTLDEISGEHLIEMIKIDVEGYEGNVVLGGDKIFIIPAIEYFSFYAA
jgi:FkbM family methyltransferase